METRRSAALNNSFQNGDHTTRRDLTHFVVNDPSVLVLYATATGTAEALAKKLAARLHRHGIRALLRDAAQSRPIILTRVSSLLLIASTYGDGEPPDDAAAFWHAVVHGTELDLRNLQFSVLALGNSTFDKFCKCGRDFDAALELHGATRFYPRVDCDMDYEAPAKKWMDGVLMSLRQCTRSALAA
jgi:sulfite reductase (NADPH) flavoprotein alpha-component